ncbi:hypothetical protein R1sor_013794 [Riccia sorocarpa]|uniref:Uncharacterized protein n=1 Tax=Riccia sorocarpa TaxID=122646 RepID=A0ABD3HB91_9MARC
MDATSLGEVEKGSNLRWPRNLLRKFTTGEDGVSWLEDTGDHCEELPDCEKVAVAEGLVTLTAPAASVNNKELGELNVGVVITQISGCVDLEILRDTSLASFSGSPMLVS